MTLHPGWCLDHDLLAQPKASPHCYWELFVDSTCLTLVAQLSHCLGTGVAARLCDSACGQGNGCGVLVDTTEREHIEQSLRKSEARLAEAQRIAHLGNWEWDLISNEVWWSDEVYRIYGYQPGSVTPSFDLLLHIVHPDDVDRIQRAVRAALHEHLPYTLDHRVVCPDGAVRWVHRQAEVVFDEQGVPLRMIGTVHDITERRRLEQRLEFLAYHDPLTGLPNRLAFIEQLDQALEQTRQTGLLTAVLFLDLDRFKVVNDSLGHQIGDQLLVAVAERLGSSLPEAVSCFRFGGDEFTILLGELHAIETAAGVAHRVLATLLAPFEVQGHELYISASIGIAATNGIQTDTGDLLRDADVAMYRAKDRGKARFEIFDPAMHADALRHLEYEAHLRRAIERDEMKVFYQPRVNLHTGRIVGMEALLRWLHPEYGLILPGEFIPLAEETGQILPIGQWMLEQACRQAQQWREQYPEAGRIVVSVNLSARQFSQPDLAAQVARALQVTGLDPAYLEFEITESAMMQDLAATTCILRQLKALGVRLAIDDFGSGYSSLIYLKQFPVDVLKIDKVFISGIVRDAADRAITEAIIGLGHALNLTVVAEGIETREQWSDLRKLGSEAGQGFYFARAIPAEDASKLLRNSLTHTVLIAPSKLAPAYTPYHSRFSAE